MVVSPMLLEKAAFLPGGSGMGLPCALRCVGLFYSSESVHVGSLFFSQKKVIANACERFGMARKCV
jgi:hypothetical protein